MPSPQSRGSSMRRREFITIVGGAAAWPLAAARAQQRDRLRRIGLLMTIAEKEPEAQARLAAFRAGLRERGWVEGRNIEIEYRFAVGDDVEKRERSPKSLLSCIPMCLWLLGHLPWSPNKKRPGKFLSYLSVLPILWRKVSCKV